MVNKASNIVFSVGVNCSSPVNGKFLLTIDINGTTCESFIPSGEVDEDSALDNDTNSNPNPPAGSDNAMWYVVAIMLISGIGIIAFAINNKKKAYVK